MVAIQSITKAAGDTNTTLLPTALFAALDSTQPNLWLPLEACQEFERAFGLTWNETAQLYLVNDTLHDILVRESAVTTFRLGNAMSGGPSVDIAFPYGSFDLTAEYPLVANSSRYFPLKRAANETQVSIRRERSDYAVCLYALVDLRLSTLLAAPFCKKPISLLTMNGTNFPSPNVHGIRPPSSRSSQSIPLTVLPERMDIILTPQIS